jgi:carbamate kinase
MSRSALVAVGGNSLIRAGEKGTIAQQLGNARRTAAAIVGLRREGYALVVTHGSGPQVGAALLRSERAADQVYALPLDVCDATAQGEIGYLLQQSLQNEMAHAGEDGAVVAVLSQVVVSADDPAMQKPSKPIGPFYSRAEAEERQRRLGWQIVEDASRGYRRVVPSPEPLEIVEEPVIRWLMEHGVLVIAVGGGGIPVVRRERDLEGVEAVIDKDRASGLLASRLGVDLFIICTDVESVFVDYKQPTRRALGRVRAAEMKEYLAAGQFPAGSMGPKVESAVGFIDRGGREAIITSYEHLREAVQGTRGTHVVP